MSRLGVRWAGALAIAAAFLPGCALTTHFAYTNTELKADSPPVPQASFDIRKDRIGKLNKKVLVLLALSGGGSRAAYFSARTMLALERVPNPEPQGAPLNVLREVDLISSVSGGSLAAAYYASSYDPGSPIVASEGRRVWDEPTIKDLMGRNYIARWVGNWFWPVNIVKFWVTAFDRTDIMAQTFADNFFDSTTTGTDVRFQGLNASRPNLVLNATIGSRQYDEADVVRAKIFGTVFTFTQEDFTAKLNSELASYEVARAVMASATFPAVFNYMTLGDLNETTSCPDRGDRCHVHVFDGGNSDNLGLLGIKRALLSQHGKAVHEYERIVVILVDAFRNSLGVDPRSANPRNAFSYVVDTNFLDAVDSLLEGNRYRTLDEFFARGIAEYGRVDECRRESLPDHACPVKWSPEERSSFKRDLDDKLFFFQVAFDGVDDLTVREKLHAIPTTFAFKDGEMDAIEKGVAEIFGEGNVRTEAYACVQRLGEVLAAPSAPVPIISGNRWCGGGSKDEIAKRKELRQSR